jgi:hypothetical protein
LTSGLTSGSPEITAVPYLLPPAITELAVEIEKPLLWILALWQALQFAASIGRTFSSK